MSASFLWAAVELIACTVLASVSFGVAWQSLRFFHLAWGAVLLGALYASWSLSTIGMTRPSIWALTIVVGVAISIAIELSIYRPLLRRGATTASMVIASLGILIGAQAMVGILVGTELKVLAGDQAVPVGPIFAVGVLAIGLGAAWLAPRTTAYRLQQAVGENLELARVLGIPAFRRRLMGMGVSGALTGVLALVLLSTVGAQPAYGLRYVLIASVAVLVGGASHIAGWVFGAVIFGGVQGAAIYLFSPALADLIGFSTLVGLVALRPRGIVVTRDNTRTRE